MRFETLSRMLFIGFAWLALAKPGVTQESTDAPSQVEVKDFDYELKSLVVPIGGPTQIVDQYLIRVQTRSAQAAATSDGGDQEKVNPVVQMAIPLPILAINVEALPPAAKSQLQLPAETGLIVHGFMSDPGGQSVSSTWPVPITMMVVRGGDLERHVIAAPPDTAALNDATRYLAAAQAASSNAPPSEALSEQFKPGDVLLAIGEHPIGSPEVLLAQLLKAGRTKEVTLHLLREGKSATSTVRVEDLILPSRRHALFEGLANTEEQFQIGVMPADVDAVTRKLLKLPNGRGVIIEKVLAGSPAERAGLVQYDIVLKVGAWFVNDVKGLVGFIQQAGGKEIELRFLREGQEQSLKVTPQAKRDFEIVDVSVVRQDAPQPGVPWTVSIDGPPVNGPIGLSRPPMLDEGHAAPPPASAPTNEQLDSQIEKVRKAVEELQLLLQRLEGERMKGKTHPAPIPPPSSSTPEK